MKDPFAIRLAILILIALAALVPAIMVEVVLALAGLL